MIRQRTVSDAYAVPVVFHMPPHEVLQQVAVNIDALIEREDGFGSHARLITVILDNFTVVVVEVPIEFDDDPVGTLNSVASPALASDPRLNIKELADEGVIGWFYVQEFQANTADTALTQMLHGNKDTHPTRLVFGIDLLGRIYHCIRQEGEEPKIVTGGQPVMTGTVPQT